MRGVTNSISNGRTQGFPCHLFCAKHATPWDWWKRPKVNDKHLAKMEIDVGAQESKIQPGTQLRHAHHSTSRGSRSAVMSWTVVQITASTTRRISTNSGRSPSVISLFISHHDQCRPSSYNFIFNIEKKTTKTTMWSTFVRSRRLERTDIYQCGHRFDLYENDSTCISTWKWYCQIVSFIFRLITIVVDNNNTNERS